MFAALSCSRSDLTFLSLLPPAAWAIAVGIFIAMLICHLVQLRAGAKLAGYVCGIVMLTFRSDISFSAAARRVGDRRRHFHRDVDLPPRAIAGGRETCRLCLRHCHAHVQI